VNTKQQKALAEIQRQDRLIGEKMLVFSKSPEMRGRSQEDLDEVSHR